MSAFGRFRFPAVKIVYLTSGASTWSAGSAAGSSLNLGASFTNAPGGTANWAFHGGTNYNDQSGFVAIVITPKALGSSSATTQSALNIAKDGTISFQINVDPSGIVDGKTITNLFTGVFFSLKVAGKTYSVQAQASVIGNVITINFQMSAELKSILAATTTATNASNAPFVGLELTGVANGGNYSLDATAYCRVFNSTK